MVAEPLAERVTPYSIGRDRRGPRRDPELDAAAATTCGVRRDHQRGHPRGADSLEELAWSDDLYPGGARFLGTLDGRSVGRRLRRPDLHVRPVVSSATGSASGCPPDARRRGLGTGSGRACSAVARRPGKTGLQTDVSERHEDGLAFLEQRGFRVDRPDEDVQLDLRGLEPPAIDPPDGIALDDAGRAARPRAGVHAVAREAYPDIPSGDEPLVAGPFDEFVAREVDRVASPPTAS